MHCEKCITPDRDCHGLDEHGHCDEYTPESERQRAQARATAKPAETVADIVREMRERWHGQIIDADGLCDALTLAARIEAAAANEKAEHGHRKYDEGYATGVRHGREESGNA